MTFNCTKCGETLQIEELADSTNYNNDRFCWECIDNLYEDLDEI